MRDEAGARFCAKLHHESSESPRYRREKQFYAAVRKAVRGKVPHDFHWDDLTATAFFEFVEGKSGFVASEQDVQQAGEFIRALQGADTKELEAASEAALQPEDHARMLEQRIAKLAKLDDKEAASFVHEQLRPSGQEVLSRLSPTAAEPIVSPSDFGFHNALRRDDGQLCFFDFEHAGFDDTAKLVCDFFVRPESGVRMDWLDIFCEAAGFGNDIKERAIGLMNLYRVKWACIALNEFTAEGGRRRNFAEIETQERRCLQLGKAKQLVQSISH